MLQYGLTELHIFKGKFFSIRTNTYPADPPPPLVPENLGGTYWNALKICGKRIGTYDPPNNFFWGTFGTH